MTREDMVNNRNIENTTRTSLHPLQRNEQGEVMESTSTSSRRPIPKEQDGFVTRWRHHILINLLLETSDVIRIGTISAIEPAMLTKWFVVISGILIGGNALYLVQWLSIKISEYLNIILVYILGICVIWMGPDMLPPLTPLNGCESIYQRILFTIALWILEKCKWSLPILHSWSLDKCLFTISGLWHLDRADYEFRKIQRETLTRISERNNSVGQDHDMGSSSSSVEDILQGVAHVLLSYCFQAGAGIGMLWASMNVYSGNCFFWSFVFYGSINALIYGLYLRGRW